MTDSAPGSDWPVVFHDLRSLLNSEAELVTVFERSLSLVGGHRRIRSLCTGLIGEDDLRQLRPGDRFGFGVTSSGPGCALPSEDEPGDRPSFWIWSSSNAIACLEPLVLSWEAGGRMVAIPDPAFLMNYGLVPRFIGGDQVRWDRPGTPQLEIVSAVSNAVLDDSTESEIKVEVNRSFLQDYATLRKMALVQCFLEVWRLPGNHQLSSRLGDESLLEEELHGLCYLRWSLNRHPARSVLFVELSGHHVLCRPGSAPISQEGYGELRWPGVEPLIRGSGLAYQGGTMDCVYVRDEVLAEFEGKSEFEVMPESGCVSLGNEWAVSFCERYGRDHLRLELRKLYEGSPPWVVHRYHDFAVARPPGEPQEMLDAPNVGTRSRRIVKALCRLSEALAGLSSHVLQETIVAEMFMAASPQDVEHQGWWTICPFKRIGNHCPTDVTVDSFLSRCEELQIAVIQKLPEGVLRRVLTGIGMAHKEIKDHRSLKLLARLVALCASAVERHLRILQDADAILSSREEERTFMSELSPLFVLNDLRNTKAHGAGGIEDALAKLDLHPNAVATGYGSAFDVLYDRVGEAVEFGARVVSEALAVAQDC